MNLCISLPRFPLLSVIFLQFRAWIRLTIIWIVVSKPKPNLQIQQNGPQIMHMHALTSEA